MDDWRLNSVNRYANVQWVYELLDIAIPTGLRRPNIFYHVRIGLKIGKVLQSDQEEMHE
jgi:hypothetical protein